MTYIDTKTLNRCKKELRRLATRSYSENETIRILESFITWANRDDDPWATSQTLVEQYKMADPEKPYTSWLVDSAARAFESNDINGEAMKILLPLPPMAYAEYEVEFTARKVERKGSRLSTSGAFHLYARKVAEVQDRYDPNPDNTSINLLVDEIAKAARGIQPINDDPWF
ncbi:hypothetical protein [Bifidobacterium asteroides]|uniref:hypothetical protein n=1 Tax=Bifidobacterium asteroides TaxID=1684 RepID=UPI001C69728B|nr:hypothetical protein [Bifidobacterium asteroides]QYN59886.1 hypothetical protein GYM67_01415 [Bifidobacterium asteroides]